MTADMLSMVEESNQKKGVHKRRGTGKKRGRSGQGGGGGGRRGQSLLMGKGKEGPSP